MVGNNADKGCRMVPSKFLKKKTRTLYSQEMSFKNKGATDIVRSTQGEKNSCLANPHYNIC